MAAKEFIVAIELGSSKIVGVAGRKNQDGSITILAEAKEESSSFISKGTVYKVPQTVKGINDIITKLKAKLQQDITQVYIGIAGQSIHSVHNKIQEDFETFTRVTPQMINQMWDKNREMAYLDQIITTAVPQEYKVDNRIEVDPEGIECTCLEGNFLNVLCREKFFTTLTECFKEAQVQVVDTYLSPLPLGDSVLTDNEKNSGCVLVDLGAGTTTISVYYKNILRHLAVVPLGGNNITKDITSLKVDESQAEQLKLKYGNAYAEDSEIDEDLSYQIDQERTVKSIEFMKIVEGRLREIVENAWNQVPMEYVEKLLGGIILTGGVSNMKNIDKAFREYTPIKKIRIASFVTHTIFSNSQNIPEHDGTMNTVLGILAKGNENCAGQEINGQEDIFGKETFVNEPEEKPAPTTIITTPPAKEQIASGVVVIPPKPQEEKNETPKEKFPQEEAKKNSNSGFGKKLQNLWKKLLEEEDE